MSPALNQTEDYGSMKEVILGKGTVEQKFESIYKNNFWEGETSVSGKGSEGEQTKELIRELPVLFEDLNISSILDIPSGDFNWMKEINLDKYNYIGADIVKGIVDKNIKLYNKKNISFKHLNIIEDLLPKVDLILVRDCLVHFSYEDISKALKNICRSKSKYLLTTIFIGRKNNKNIITGDWRPLNLCKKPFFLPEPIKIINENCTEYSMSYTDKSLGPWKISDIAKVLN